MMIRVDSDSRIYTFLNHVMVNMCTHVSTRKRLHKYSLINNERLLTLLLMLIEQLESYTTALLITVR